MKYIYVIVILFLIGCSPIKEEKSQDGDTTYILNVNSVGSELVLSNTLKCDIPYAYSPMNSSDVFKKTTNSKIILEDGGVTNKVDVHVSNEIGGIGVGLLLNGINVIGSKSAGGAAWQTSYLLRAPKSPNTYVFNQAAGNAGNLGRQWGYSNEFLSKDYSADSPGYIEAKLWNPIASDHIHDGETHSPCQNNSIQLDYGRGKFLLDKVVVGKNSQIAKVTNDYTLKAKMDQTWEFYAVEQAFYLERRIAGMGHLKIYLKGKDKKIYGPMDIVNEIDKAEFPKDMIANVYDWGGPALKLHNNIDYAIFVWIIKGKEMAVALKLPENYESIHLMAPYCEDPSNSNNMECGYISWHTFYENKYEANGLVRFAKDEETQHEITHYVGSKKQIFDFVKSGDSSDKSCGDVKHNDTIERIRYLSSESDMGKECLFETQVATCSNDSFSKWSGTYTKTACAQKVKRYKEATVANGGTCLSETKSRVCRDGICGVYDGSYDHIQCEILAGKSCGGISSGQSKSRIMYKSNRPSVGVKCIFETQEATCNNGAFGGWSGTYTSASCSTKDGPSDELTVSSDLNCDIPWAYTPMNYSDIFKKTTNSKIFLSDGKNKNKLDIHVSNEIGGIGVGLLLNGINVIGSKSVGGAAWQTSYLLRAPNSKNTYVFNQAAGNTGNLGKQWGYANEFSSKDYSNNGVGYIEAKFWNPIDSDHIHEGETHSPCQKDSIQLDYGRGKITIDKLAINQESQIAKVTNDYILKAKMDQTWGFYAVEQALYFSRKVASMGRLKMYIKGKDSKLYGPIDPVNKIDRNEFPQDMIVYNVADSAIKLNNKIAYVVFVWEINGEEMAVALRLPEDYVAIHLLLEKTPYCGDPTDMDCGNISWHTFHGNKSSGLVRLSKNEENHYPVTHFIGSKQQIFDFIIK